MTIWSFWHKALARLCPMIGMVHISIKPRHLESIRYTNSFNRPQNISNSAQDLCTRAPDYYDRGPNISNRVPGVPAWADLSIITREFYSKAMKYFRIWFSFANLFQFSNPKYQNLLKL